LLQGILRGIMGLSYSSVVYNVWGQSCWFCVYSSPSRKFGCWLGLPLSTQVGETRQLPIYGHI